LGFKFGNGIKNKMAAKPKQSLEKLKLSSKE
jgi:hypothetical protein